MSKNSRFISMLLVFVMVFTLMTPGFAQVQEGKDKYGEANHIGKDTLPLANTVSGTAISAVSTPGALGYEFDPEKKEITKYTGTETEIVIPSELDIDGKTVPVESIGKEVFSRNKKIVKVTVPKSIKTIGNKAFYMAQNLKEVILNDGLIEIGDNAFYYTKIEEIDIPQSVQSIGEKAFCQCLKLIKVNLNGDLKEIGEKAFYNTKIEEIDIPNGVQTIGKEVFAYCTKLIQVTLHKGLKEIGSKAFSQATIKEINIPDSVETMGVQAFYKCGDLSMVVLNDGLKEIPTSAFSNTAIKKIDIPSSVQTIDDNAFTDCESLSEVILHEGLKEIGMQSFSKTSIEEMVIPSTIETIGAYIFKGNNEISKVTVMNKKEKINVHTSAFANVPEVIYKEKEEPGEEDNVIIDTVLKKIINLKLGKEDLDAPVTKEELAGIEEMISTGSNLDGNELWKLKSLEGLQYASNLTRLDLYHVQVTDLEPLKGLPKLENICIDGSYGGDDQESEGEKSALKDITPVSEMEQLKILRIIGTQLEDIKPISNLKNLQNLHLMNNEISDISCLKDVPISDQLFLEGNCIGDFLPVKDMDAFKAAISERLQRVTIFPETTEFDNPLIRSSGSYMVLPENEYVVNTGDDNEKIKILKMPTKGNTIEIEYGTNTLTVDLSKLNVIKDPVLKKAVNLYRNEKFNETRMTDQAVQKSDLTELKEFNLDYITEDERKEIKDITGLENLQDATELSLKGTSVENLGPISNLTKLESIFLGGSYYDDGSPYVYLKYNNTKWRSPLKDISPLAGLTNLRSIWLNDSEVVDVSVLKNLKNLDSVYLMRNKIEDVVSFKDVSISGVLYLQGNCISDFSPLKGKNALKINLGQSVNIILEKSEFDNPLKDAEGKYVKLPENEYITNTGENGEKLKVLKLPDEGNVITIEYGSTDGLSTLSADVSKIRNEFDNPSEKYKIYFHVMQGGNDTGTIDDAQVHVWNGKGEELTNENTVQYVWSLPDGRYTYKVTHSDYIDVEGEFEVNGEELTVEVSLTSDSDRLITFSVKDEKGNVIDPAKVEKLEVSISLYKYTIDDMTKPTAIVFNGSDMVYNYFLSLKDYGTFSGSFRLDENSSDEVVLTVDISKDPGHSDDDPDRPNSSHGGSSRSTAEEEQPKESVETEIPAGSESGREIELGNSHIKISSDAFDKKVVLTAKEEDSSLEMKAVDEKGKNAEIKKPLLVTIHYEGEVKNKDNVTVVLTDETGKEEPVGGVYDTDTGTVKFFANKLGKFTVREGKKKFKDTSHVDWAETAIESVSVKGIMREKKEDMFEPSDYITRGEFAAVISEMLKLNKNIASDVPFDDVTKDKWYYGSVAAVYENGLINGKTAASFDPEGYITRQEMIEIIGSLLESSTNKEQNLSELDKFKDKASIASWAESSVAAAVNNGIIVGIGGDFMPDKNATRAETAVMVYRLYSVIMNR